MLPSDTFENLWDDYDITYETSLYVSNAHRAWHWRHRRALLMRYQGMTYKSIGANLGVSKERARQIIGRGAGILVKAKARGIYDTRTKIELALWLLRMRTFNRHIARREQLKAKLCATHSQK